MNFVLEDGAARHDANSYADPDFAREYASERHRPILLALTEEQLNAALVRATDYIDGRWAQTFIGTRKTSTQALAWPRDYAYDERGILITVIPTQLKKATVEMAERATQLDKLVPDPPSPYPVADADGTVADVTSGQLVSIRQKVDTLETEKHFTGSVSNQTRDITSAIIGGVSVQEFPQVKLLLRPLIRGMAGNSTFVRY